MIPASRSAPRFTNSSNVPLAIAFFLTLTSVSGCNWLERFSASAEDRINRLQPVPASLARALDVALHETKSDLTQLRRFEDELQSRMKVRAVECSRGLSPSALTSDDDILRRLDADCMTRRDADTERWIGLWRAGRLAALPPLRAIPTNPPEIITAEEQIAQARFAASAGVAMLELQKQVHIVDLANGAVIHKENRPSRGTYGPLSPNGQLFVSSEGEKTWIRSVRSGENLVELSSRPAYELRWLGSDALLYMVSHGFEARVADLKLAKDYQLRGIRVSGSQAAPSPSGTAREFVILGSDGLWKVALPTSDQDEPATRVIAERRMPIRTLTGRDGLNSDGTAFVDGWPDMAITDLATLEVETVSFAPFVYEASFPGPTADQYIVQMHPRDRAAERRYYVYSRALKTMAPIDTSRLPSANFTFVRPLGRVAVIAEYNLSMTALPVGVPQSLNSLIDAEVSAANQRKLDAVARVAAAADADPSGALATKLDGPLAGVTPQPGPMAAMARDAIVEAIGVYQPRRTSGVGTIDVRIRRSSKPLILVLAAYESVRWNLYLEPGAKLAAVLTSGYKDQYVAGSAGARVMIIGQAYAYESANTRELEREVFRITAKPIAVFQGKYEGSSFVVGGL